MKNKQKERYSNMKLVTSIHEAAKTLLAFFHQICKGKTLLDVDWEKAESVKRIARISEIEANFLKYLVGVVEKRGKIFLEKHLFFITSSNFFMLQKESITY